MSADVRRDSEADVRLAARQMPGLSGGVLEQSDIRSRTRVAMPMLNLVPGGMGGTETYMRELTQGLGVCSDIEVTAYLPASASGATAGVSEQMVPGIHGGATTRQRVTSLARGMLDRRLGQRLARSSDVVHFPFTVPIPRGHGRPWATTLHDVQHLDLPRFFPAAERTYRRLAYDWAARNADAVFTVSEFCKARIQHHLGVPAERIAVAHLAVGSDFTPFHGPRDPFVLYPARRWPHKNHDRLLAAMTLVREHRPDLQLVLTGGGAPLDRAPDWVQQRGLVSREELVELYRSASCLAFASLYEGFGLPPLEAMASGTPVAFASSGALPEVCGSAGVSFDPLNVDAMARAILEAIDGRDRLVPLGLRRAQRFTWDRCVRVHADTYRKLSRAAVAGEGRA